MIERRFIFFPERVLQGTPAHWGLGFEEVYFPASDGARLHGWFVPGNGEVSWIWFHGNAGNISHLLENLMLLHTNLGMNIFLFDYRGYGLSQGRPSEKGTYRDARGALDYLHSRQDIAPQHIVYFGQSLGSAVAVWLATQQQPAGLILESPFASVADMAKIACPRLPLYLLVRNKYNSLSRIAQISCPLLFLHGDRDDIVPLSQGRKLYEAAAGAKTFHIIPGAGHNDTHIIGREPYYKTLAVFIASLNG